MLARLPLCFVINLLLVITPTIAFANTPIQQVVHPFLKAHCVGCHGPEEQKGDRRFDSLKSTISDDDSLVDYQDILDQLNLSEMPPLEAKQPSDAARQKVIDVLTTSIASYHQSRSGQHAAPILRRLNAREYRNTIRDLLDLDTTIFDPTEPFPRDQTTQHLDNVGEELVTSSHLLSAYLNAADTIIEKALFPPNKPKVQTWKFRDGFRQQPEIDQVHRKTNQYRHMTLYDVIGADKPEGAYGPIHAFAEGVPYDGYYEIRLKAEAVNRFHPYHDSFLGIDRNEKLRLGIRPGNHEVGSLHLPQPNEPLLAEIELKDKPEWYTTKVWLDEGFTPRFTFRNGLMDARNLWTKLIKKYRDQFPPNLKGIVAMRYNAIKHGKLPHIRIHEIEIKGPLYEQWPRASQAILLGEDAERVLSGGELSDNDIRSMVRSFATRAYRRPVTQNEVKQIVGLVQARRESGRTEIEAIADGFKAILCSPGFLYLATNENAQASDDALASRLSYFLWASMPDEELLKLANGKQLRQPEILKQQVQRMLADSRSDAFVNGFLDSWLTMRELGSAPPDRSDFREFYHYDLGTAMRHETFSFVRYLIDENLSVSHFLDSDFTFVNKPLAKLYGLPLPASREFQKVVLNDARRGGLLGHASVLTVTANGIDTSPVVRGVWMLENLLGTPPSPPPPDVEPLDPDVRGAKTIRDQLRKHRDVATCNECHRKIDPLGFALETYDPIGRWRERYDRKIKVDPSGELPNGEKFEDIRDLKRILMANKDQVTKALVEKLLSYACGRQMTATDRPDIDRIVESTKTNAGMRDVIEQVVLSDAFRQTDAFQK